TFRNNWEWHMGGTLGQLGTTYDDRASRGGPAVRQDPYFSPWLFIVGDDRMSVIPGINVNYFRGAEGRNRSFSVQPELRFKAAGSFSSAVSFRWAKNVADNQWYGNFDEDDGTHH